MSYKVYVHKQYCDWVSQILIYFFYFYFFAFLLMSSLIPELAHFSLLSSLLLPIITVGSAHDNYGGTHGLYRPFFPPRAPSPIPIPTFPIKKLINFVLFTLPWYVSAARELPSCSPGSLYGAALAGHFHGSLHLVHWIPTTIFLGRIPQTNRPNY